LFFFVAIAVLLPAEADERHKYGILKNKKKKIKTQEQYKAFCITLSQIEKIEKICNYVRDLFRLRVAFFV
jgi:hypothetical protein